MKVTTYMLRAMPEHYSELLERLKIISMTHTKTERGDEQFLMPGGKVVLRITPQKNSGCLFDLHVKRTTLLEPSYVKRIVRKYSSHSQRVPIMEHGTFSIDGLLESLPSAPIFGGRA